MHARHLHCHTHAANDEHSLGPQDFCKTREEFCSEFGFHPRDDYFALDGFGIGANCLALGLQGFFFLGLLFFIEWAGTRGTNRRGVVETGLPDQDEDVAAERVRVSAGHANEDAVVMNTVTRAFGSKLAVNRVITLGCCMLSTQFQYKTLGAAAVLHYVFGNRAYSRRCSR